MAEKTHHMADISRAFVSTISSKNFKVPKIGYPNKCQTVLLPLPGYPISSVAVHELVTPISPAQPVCCIQITPNTPIWASNQDVNASSTIHSFIQTQTCESFVIPLPASSPHSVLSTLSLKGL